MDSLGGAKERSKERLGDGWNLRQKDSFSLVFAPCLTAGFRVGERGLRMRAYKSF